MKSKTKMIILIIILLIVAGYFGFRHLVYGGARDLTKEETAFTVTSDSLVQEFTTHQDVANQKYLEKAVAVSGLVTEVDSTEITLNNTVICVMKEPVNQELTNKNIEIKGRVVGYDDLMGEVKLDECFITKNK